MPAISERRSRVEDIDHYASSDDATIGEGHSVFQANERAVIIAVPKDLFPGGEVDANYRTAIKDRLMQVVAAAMEPKTPGG